MAGDTPLHLRLKSGRAMPLFGLGTWGMGESARTAESEIAALKRGLDHGISLIDTAEMYGEGGAEKVVGRAVAGRRDAIFIVSKVYPHNASRAGVIAACERSLRRLATDRIDLYLLHWPGSEPLEETIAGFETLRRQGKIGDWGVSNFDVDDMADLAATPGGGGCMVNQVLYNLGERGIEWQLLPECGKSGCAIMAYTPLGQGAILQDKTLAAIAAKHGATPAAIALAFLLSKGVIVIPKAVNIAHVDANIAALSLALGGDDLAQIDRTFPPPTRKKPLAML